MMMQILKIKLQKNQKRKSKKKEKTWKYFRDHPIDQVIGDPIQGVRTRGAMKLTCEYAAYISQFKPKNFKEAENEESWILAMQE